MENLIFALIGLGLKAFVFFAIIVLIGILLFPVVWFFELIFEIITIFLDPTYKNEKKTTKKK